MFLFDWLTYTSKVDGVDSIQKQLGLSNAPWIAGPGQNGYWNGWALGGISIWHNPSRPNMPNICVSLSGQGCRDFESLSPVDWKALFDLLISYPDEYNITRLDIAYDDTEGILPLDKIRSDVENHNYVSPFRAFRVEVTDNGLTVSVGSKKSEAMIRMYDKAAERGYTDGRHWVRVELQLRRERAASFVGQYLRGGFADDLGLLWKSVVLGYVRFVSPQKKDSDSRRWPMRKYWKKLMDTASAVKLYQSPGVGYNAMNLDRFISKQCSGAIYTFVKVNSWEALKERIEHRNQALNPKYERLISEVAYQRTLDEAFWKGKK